MPNGGGEERFPGGFPGGESGEELEGKTLNVHENVVTRFKRREDGEIHSETTIHSELPEPVMELLKKNDLQLKFHNPAINRILLPDQSADMMSTDGCISSPGGPPC
jgi:hypothetical protein